MAFYRLFLAILSTIDYGIVMNHCYIYGLKEYRMVFRAGLRDPCTWESVKILKPQASVFLRFPKVEQHPKCTDHAILLGKPFGNCFIK
jgi:hypothetical protein